MRLHNKLKIIKGNNEYEFFNSLLLPAVEFLSELKPYFSYIAIGGSSAETIENQTTLNEWSKTYPLTTKEYNINPLNGTLFITKTLNLGEDEKTALKIGEIGVSADGAGVNPKVANRFVVNGGNAIFRDAGEPITFEVTIFLELGESKQVALTAGDNNLVSFLLGSYSSPKFSVARGFNTTANDSLIERDVTNLEQFDAQISSSLDASLGTLTMKIEADINEGMVEEILLILDGKAVARCNVSETVGLASGLKEGMIADWDNMATLSKSGVNEITSVTDETDGTEVTDYTITKYGTTFVGGFQEVFQNAGYTASTKRVLSRTLDKIGFVHDDKIDIYDVSGDTPVLMDGCSSIDAKNAYLFLLAYDFLIVKYLNETSGAYNANFYRYLDGKWAKYGYYLNTNAYWYPGVNKDEIWYDIDIAPMDTTDNCDKLFTIASHTYLWTWQTYLTSSSALSYNEYFYNTYYKIEYIRSMFPSNRIPTARFVSYDTKNNQMAVIDGVGSHQEFTDELAIDITKNYRDLGYPKVAKNFAFALDQTSKKLKAFSIDSGEGKSIQLSSAEKLFVSDALDYMVVKRTDGDYKIYYLDGSLKPYEFLGGFPDVNAQIVDFVFVKDKIIAFLEDNRVMIIKINKNKFIVNGVTKGHQILVEYSANNTPGISGGNVYAVIKIEARV